MIDVAGLASGELLACLMGVATVALLMSRNTNVDASAVEPMTGVAFWRSGPGLHLRRVEVLLV